MAVDLVEIPNKIKHFLCRVAHNSHPLRANLGMEVESRCVFCNKEFEDGGHLYFKCSLAKQFWLELGAEEHRPALATIGSAREVVRYILILKPKIQLLACGHGRPRETGSGKESENPGQVGEELCCRNC